MLQNCIHTSLYCTFIHASHFTVASPTINDFKSHAIKHFLSVFTIYLMRSDTAILHLVMSYFTQLTSLEFIKVMWLWNTSSSFAAVTSLHLCNKDVDGTIYNTGSGWQTGFTSPINRIVTVKKSGHFYPRWVSNTLS